ncbi:MAG: hypothetical protein E7057_04155 [Lentisphaerae bacterium]|nr:hypothetical protein [Lentisphaerota bacterium]
MKKFFLGLLALPLLIAAQEIPSSITVTCGKTVLRLDAAKRWNINSIQVDGEQLAIDHPGAHYGMTYMPAGAKGFIGSGHTETGKVETVKNIRFFIDGKTAVPQVQMSAKNSFYMEKVSEIGDFEVTYSFNLTGGILFERTMLKTLRPASVTNVYCFMHPWSTVFTRLYGITPDGDSVDIGLSSDGKFPTSGYLPKIAMLNPATETAIATIITPVRHNGSRMKRLMWDRKVYHKDYFVPFSETVLPADYTAEFTAKTVFFKASPAHFVPEAQRIFLLH